MTFNPDFIFHIIDKTSLDTLIKNKHYSPQSLGNEGFVHCCKLEQISGVIDRYFENSEYLYYIKMNYNRIKADIKWEQGPTGDFLPHLYRALTIDDISESNLINAL